MDFETGTGFRRCGPLVEENGILSIGNKGLRSRGRLHNKYVFICSGGFVSLVSLTNLIPKKEMNNELGESQAWIS